MFSCLRENLTTQSCITRPTPSFHVFSTLSTPRLSKRCSYSGSLEFPPREMTSPARLSNTLEPHWLFSDDWILCLQALTPAQLFSGIKAIKVPGPRKAPLEDHLGWGGLASKYCSGVLGPGVCGGPALHMRVLCTILKIFLYISGNGAKA